MLLEQHIDQAVDGLRAEHDKEISHLNEAVESRDNRVKELESSLLESKSQLDTQSLSVCSEIIPKHHLRTGLCLSPRPSLNLLIVSMLLILERMNSASCCDIISGCHCLIDRDRTIFRVCMGDEEFCCMFTVPCSFSQFGFTRFYAFFLCYDEK